MAMAATAIAWHDVDYADETSADDSKPALLKAFKDGLKKRFSNSLAAADMGFPDQSAEWLADKQSQAIGLLQLKENWNSYSARAISPAAIAGAIQILNEMAEKNMPAPDIFPVPNGSIQIEWHKKGFDIEILINSPIEMHLYIEKSLTEEIIEDRVLLSDFRPLSKVTQLLGG